MMETEEIINLIKEALPDALVEIKDLRGDGDNYAVYVESQAFAGKSRVQQHRMIFAALQGRVGGVLKELSINTAIPEKR